MIFKGIKTLLWKAYLLKNTIFKKKVYTELKNITQSLEKDVFAQLQESGFPEAFAEITEAGLKIMPNYYFLPISGEMAAFFKNLGITGMKMDTLLESNQLLDILKDMDAMKKNNHLLTDGYEAYCAITRFLPELGLLSVKYHYCELNYSKTIRDIKEKSGAKGHRIFFRKAQRYSIVTALLIMTLGLIYPYLPRQVSITLSILIGMAAGIMVFIALETIGSLEYDKEYLEKRLKDKK